MTLTKKFTTSQGTQSATTSPVRSLPGRFAAPGSRSAIRTDGLRRRAEGGLDRLREGLLNQTLAQVQSTALVRPILRAAQEAAALAWLEEFPLLVFPCLLQEKVDAAKHRAQRQLWVEAQTSDFLETTA